MIPNSGWLRPCFPSRYYTPIYNIIYVTVYRHLLFSDLIPAFIPSGIIEVSYIYLNNNKKNYHNYILSILGERLMLTRHAKTTPSSKSPKIRALRLKYGLSNTILVKTSFKNKVSE